MARKKKITEEPVIKTLETAKKEITVNTKETCLFKITSLTDNVKLYKYPTIKDAQGKLKKGQVYNVICEINYTPIKMYKLSTGYYIIADQNIQKI